MTTLELKITDNGMVDTVIKSLSKFKCVKIEEKEESSEAGKGLISALEELDAYKRGEIKLENARDFLKTL